MCIRDRTTAERSASVNIFRRRKAQLLVATDVAARGMDIPGLRDVIMLNLPIHAEDYVHRIGRVGRAGKPGWAWALVSDADKRRLEKIEKLLGRTLPSRAIPSLIAEEHREPRQDDDDLVRARAGRGAGQDLRERRPARRSGGADRGPGFKKPREDRGERKPRSNDRPGRSDRGPRGSKGLDRNDSRRGQKPSGRPGAPRGRRS